MSNTIEPDIKNFNDLIEMCENKTIEPDIKNFSDLIKMCENKTIECENNVPIIKFKKHGSMGGRIWDDATPVDYWGSGVPILEHKKIYEECEKNKWKWYWDFDDSEKNKK